MVFGVYLSSTHFRQIENLTGAAKADKLFKAAVSAFCALTRPSRAEIAQLDDLAMPLVDEVSRETRRYAAAALSECAHAPPLLIRRLAGDSPDIAAALLIRSPVIRDVDLITVIANCGLPHARIIARRTKLSKPVADLLRALRDPEIGRLRALVEGREADPAERSERLNTARRRLRAMMRPTDSGTYYPGLRDAALTGRLGLFQTSLADALGLDFEKARQITEAEDLGNLATALRALELEGERAFVLLSAIWPLRFKDTLAIRRFLRDFERRDVEESRDLVRNWKANTIGGLHMGEVLQAS